MSKRFVVGIVLLAVAGCSSHHSSGELNRLRATASLDACPDSGTSAVMAKLPDLTLSCLGAGPRVRMRALGGVATLVNVWGSWCQPCQREVPALQSVYAGAQGRLRVLGVDTEDDPLSALDFAAHVGMKYPSVADDNGTFIRALGRNATPMTLFVDASGAVVHTKYGQFRNLADIKAEVQRYLGIAV
jgi:cytochrome c biogenesis protein CcmG/thiol:disulfide interchange protein DsbE